MAVNLTNADSALKSAYLDAITTQLNNHVNPFFAAIEKSTSNVTGKEVRKLCIHGMNGGVGAGTEDGALPSATGNNYTEFVSPLKNLYGVIEISDKALRASENDSGALINLLNAEMDGLIQSSIYNFGRMLFGDGSGVLGEVVGYSGKDVIVNGPRNFIEGMYVDFRDTNGNIVFSGKRIKSVYQPQNIVIFEGENLTEDIVPTGSLITVQGSYNNEITGLGALFNKDKKTIYGLDKEDNYWLQPLDQNFGGGEIDETILQMYMDEIEMQSGKPINLFLCSMGVKRALYKMLSKDRKIFDTVEIAGGYKTLSYNGIPIVADRFCPRGTLYMLNTNDFALHQLCDWQWLADEDGKILRQVPGKPVYTATLVKYADLICTNPCGQGIIRNLAEA
ncbi:MAG: phage major capsid protein [Clostridia bacterium]|nr:phage major capsid protein [Clostridia bacterium]